MTGLLVFLALLVDRLVGEPARWHPLVMFGHWASRCEQYVNPAVNHKDSCVDEAVVLRASSLHTKILGLFAWGLMVVPLVLCAAWVGDQLQTVSTWGYFVFSLCVLQFTIGWQSLREHALVVSQALQQQNIETAREAVGRIVSRDTDSMDESAVSRATIESVLENGSDAIFAPLFWFCVLGPAGALAYRLANTLDAMWGYRTARFHNFGYAAARLDDVFNWLPARLTAVSYALMGHWQKGWRCWQQQAQSCASPNGGPVMCAGAGALNIYLGGGAFYHGQWQARPEMGCDAQAQGVDIDRALTLIQRSVCLWVVVIVLLAVCFYA